MAFGRALVIAAFVALAVPAGAVMLDPGFGTGGKVFDIGTAVGIVVEPGTGRIFTVTGGAPTVLACFLTNGTLDASFGVGGRVVINDSQSNDHAFALARQPGDGRLLILGNVSMPAGASQAYVLRYDADGNLDASFGSGGRANLATPAFARAILPFPDGTILVAGQTNQERYPAAIVRLLADGTPDVTFGTAGVVDTGTAAGGNLSPLALARVDADHVVAGGTDDGTNFVLAKYDAAGTLDATFGVGGRVATRPASVTEDISVDSLVLQTDGRIVAVGSVPPDPAITAGPFPWIAARYLADGTLDPAYGVAGTVVVRNRRLVPRLHAVLDDDGVVVTSGFLSARIDAGGVLDPTYSPCVFAVDLTVVGLSRFDAAGRPIARQDDGKLVMAGTHDFSLAMLRYTRDNAACMPAAPAGSTIVARAVNGEATPRLKWKWKSSAPVPLADFGHPLDTDEGDSYAACLLDATSAPGLRGTVFAGPLGCPFPTRVDPCWTPIGDDAGYRLRVRSKRDQFFDVTLRPGSPGKIIVKARDMASTDIHFPPYDAPVVMRFERSGSPFCWDATFSAPTRNDTRFIATSD
jgi:uncharacterized delta-60 repeat protein